MDGIQKLGFALVMLLPLNLIAAELISVNSSGTDAGDLSSLIGSEEISPFSSDGRYLVFHSSATDLVTTDSNGSTDLFLRDRQTDVTTLISVNAAGTDSGNGSSFNGSISADGRYVFFRSSASDLATTDTNGMNDLFIRDRNTNTTTMITKNSAGTDSADASSFSGTMTPDGRFVVFTSAATNLVSTDTNATNDVYRYSVLADTVTLVSMNDAGNDSGNSFSFSNTRSSISDEGRFIVFRSDASDLIAADANGNVDVFVYDAMTTDITRVSDNVAGTAGGNGDSSDAIISANGSMIVFSSDATDLVATSDLNAISDFFAYDVVAESMAMVTVNAAGNAAATGGAHVSNPRISGDGRYLVFESNATDLTTLTDNNGTDDMFLRDLVGATTILVSTNAAGTASANGQPDDPQISLDGRFIYYESAATDVVSTPDNNMQKDSFVYDRTTGITYLLSINNLGTETGNDFSYDPNQSPDGLHVQLDSRASNIGTGADTNATTDVYVTELIGLIPGLVAAAPGGGGGSGTIHPVLLFTLLLLLVPLRRNKGE